MNICGLEKLTVTDYPGYVSCIIFTQGCNFNCPFCHNSSLIPFGKGTVTEDEVFAYLEKRKKILDGVVITGGEPLLQLNIKDFIKKIKELGLKVKLDTNGTNYKMLKELIDDGLIDYIAMDIKNDMANYEAISGYKKFNFNSVKETIKLIESSNIDYEFRTTLVKEFHKYQNIENICEFINQKSKYYLQNFENNEAVLTGGLHGFAEGELKNMAEKLKEKHSNIIIRGL